MQAIHDLDVKFISRLSLHYVRLQNQVHDLHVKFKCYWSIWLNLAYQTAVHAENEKNIKLHS